jgi:simple sugar transport system ATP-binding protein
MDAPDLETVGMTMRFGAFTALDDVSIKVRPGTVHVLLGENGAGKSTLVKCMMGFYHATSGELLVNGREARIADPVDAQRLGLGMVYQHFTLVPSLTGAENLVVSRNDVPGVIDWKAERWKLDNFLATLPFQPPLDRPVSRLSAGEKQKLEIVKQLYLGNRFLILDEPTSVLTPAEAQEVLSHIRDLATSGQITVLLITHKFREVMAFGDDVSVLRRGKYVGGGAIADLTEGDMARMMMGEDPDTARSERTGAPGAEVLSLQAVRAPALAANRVIEIDNLRLHAGEILGIAGISGNGQSELMEVLTGQRTLTEGSLNVKGRPYRATRAEARALKVRYLPEEPLKNASAPKMRVADNLSFRSFDHDENGLRFWTNRKQIARLAEEKIAEFDIKTTSARSPIAALSGGNVQRTVLARELSGDVDLLIVANPCFGLDFKAVTAIRGRLIAARNAGVAVLLISEDLDEIFELADRVAVLSDNRIVFQAPRSDTNAAEIGTCMAGAA